MKLNANNILVKVTMQNAADHEATMKGLITALRLATTNQDKREHDADALAYVFDLLEALIPEETELENGIEYDKPASMQKAA